MKRNGRKRNTMRQNSAKFNLWKLCSYKIYSYIAEISRKWCCYLLLQIFRDIHARAQAEDELVAPILGRTHAVGLRHVKALAWRGRRGGLRGGVDLIHKSWSNFRKKCYFSPEILRNSDCWVGSGAEVRKSCSIWKMLQNEYSLVNIGFDGAENIRTRAF